MFLIIGIIFLPFGLLCLQTSNHVIVLLPLVDTGVSIIFISLGITDVLIILVQIAEIIHRYDFYCVPNAYRGNRQGYSKDSSISKNCTLQAKVDLYVIITEVIFILFTFCRLYFFVCDSRS
jgi:hypothetical protein